MQYNVSPRELPLALSVLEMIEVARMKLLDFRLAKIRQPN